MSQPNDPDLDAELAAFRAQFDRQAKILGHLNRETAELKRLETEFRESRTPEEADGVIARLRKLTLGEGEKVH